MRAMVLERAGVPLSETELPDPKPRPGEVLVRVNACGVCRTDLHIVDGELTEPKLPLVPGHQVVGEVVAAGEGADRLSSRDPVAGVGVRRVSLLHN
jgi:propanol-preferring alcohol dehydrogenase